MGNSMRSFKGKGKKKRRTSRFLRNRLKKLKEKKAVVYCPSCGEEVTWKIIKWGSELGNAEICMSCLDDHLKLRRERLKVSRFKRGKKDPVIPAKEKAGKKAASKKPVKKAGGRFAKRRKKK